MTMKGQSIPGFTVRSGWHVLPEPRALRLSKRCWFWAQKKIEEYDAVDRPKFQDGKRYLAAWTQILEVLG
jgi:hypothetical protein